MAQVQDIAPQPPPTHVDWATADDTIQEQSFKRHWALPRTRWRPVGCGSAGRVGGKPPLPPEVAPPVGARRRFRTATAPPPLPITVDGVLDSQLLDDDLDAQLGEAILDENPEVPLRGQS